MVIAITGASGMLGRELSAALRSRDLVRFDHLSCDITSREMVFERFRAASPDVVVHLAAFTKVNECQRRPERAYAVNDEGTRHVAEAATEVGARLVYISTDYVFDGRKRTPYLEDDPTGPVNVYGKSKAAGETHAGRASHSLIVRCGWLFGAGGRNFVEAIRKQIADGTPLRVVGDQVGTPIWTRHLAAAIAALIEREVSGVVHAAATGQCSWHEFATSIVELTHAGVPVEAMSTPADGTPRPAFTVLGDSRLRALGIGPLPHWRDGLREYLSQP